MVIIFCTSATSACIYVQFLLVFCMPHLLEKDISMQHVLVVYNGCLIKQSDGKLSQRLMMYINDLIILIWSFLNRL